MSAITFSCANSGSEGRYLLINNIVSHWHLLHRAWYEIQLDWITRPAHNFLILHATHTHTYLYIKSLTPHACTTHYCIWPFFELLHTYKGLNIYIYVYINNHCGVGYTRIYIYIYMIHVRAKSVIVRHVYGVYSE